MSFNCQWKDIFTWMKTWNYSYVLAKLFNKVSNLSALAFERVLMITLFCVIDFSSFFLLKAAVRNASNIHVWLYTNVWSVSNFPWVMNFLSLPVFPLLYLKILRRNNPLKACLSFNPSFVFNLSKEIKTKHIYRDHLLYLMHCDKAVIFSVCTAINPSDAVRTTPEKFENAAFFLRLALQFTLIRLKNGAFRKRSLNRRNLTTPALRVSVDGKHSENGAFRKRSIPIIMWFPRPSFTEAQIQKDRWLLRFQMSLV